jgi:NAD(P)-dependent dehydrogenase (short-subunit alcohol dehydrogenase family)
MTKLLQGRSVLITGAGSNVGRAAAVLFVEHGASLVLTDLDPARIAADPARRFIVAGDLTSAAVCEAAVAEAIARFGKLDVLCNTIGIDPPGARNATETSEADWDRVMAVNLKAVFLACRAALAPMQAAKSGVIVNVASQGALLTLPGMTAYGVSKAGVLQLTRQIAADYAASGIRANCVCPSGLEQPSLDRLDVLAEADLARRTETMRRISPLGRVCSPEDVANAMLFLASELAAYTTGAALPVEGGATMRLRF